MKCDTRNLPGRYFWLWTWMIIYELPIAVLKYPIALKVQYAPNLAWKHTTCTANGEISDSELYCRPLLLYSVTKYYCRATLMNSNFRVTANSCNTKQPSKPVLYLEIWSSRHELKENDFSKHEWKKWCYLIYTKKVGEELVFILILSISKVYFNMLKMTLVSREEWLLFPSSLWILNFDAEIFPCK